MLNKRQIISNFDKKGLLTVYFVVLISMIAIGLSRPAVTFKIKGMEAQGFLGLKIGLLTTAFFIFRALGATLSANVKNKRFVATVGFFGFSFCLFVYNLSGEYLPIILTKPLEGFLAGLTWPLVQLLVGVFTAEKWRITSMTIYFMVGRIGIQSGNIFYGLINSIFISLFIASLLMFISAFPIFKIYSGSLDTKEKSELITKRAIIQPSPIYLAAFATGFNCGLAMELTLFYLNVIKSLSEAQASIFYGIAGLTTLLIPVVKGYLADVYSRKLIVSISLALVSLGSFILSLNVVKELFVIIPLIIYITGIATLQSLVRGLAVLARKPQKTIGYTNAFGNIGAAVSPVIGGLLIPIKFGPFDSVFMIAGSFIAAFTLFLFLKAKI